MKKVISFDVFDTLLTRKVGLPGHIFLLTGRKIKERLNLDVEPEVFANAREIAENEPGSQSVDSFDIYAIYEKLTEQLEISPDLSNTMAEIEMEIETEELIAVEENVKLLENLRNSGHQIVYISDMYLGEEFIRRLLNNYGICTEDEKIYVSCEHGTSKSTGKLFDVVLQELGISAEQLHHYGNSSRADIEGAKIAGVSATYLPEGNLNRYEQYLTEVNKQYRMSVDQTLMYSRMAAASRLSRLQRDEQKKQIYDVASSVAAPILYRFVAHVLKKAMGKKIYFLARDGHIMYRVAERIIQAKGWDADINYLYISRETLVLAGFEVMKLDSYLEYVVEIFSNESLKVLLNKLSVSDYSIKESNISDNQLSKLIAEFDKEELKKILLDDPINQDIKIDSQKRKNRLFSYLRSEGLLSNDERIIVDVGWSLTIQNLMADLLATEGISPPEGYYFGINESAGSSIQRGKKNGFLWDQRKDKFFEPPHKIIRIFEVFCSAPHGQTIDYRRDGNSINPVFNTHEARHLSEWGLNDMQEGILKTIENLLQFRSEYRVSGMDDRILMEIVTKFWQHPSREEVKTWGKYPYSIIKHERRVVNLFQKESFPKLIMHILKKGKLPNSSLDHWPNAYLNSLSPIKRMTLTNTLKAKRNLSSMKKDLTAQISTNGYSLLLTTANTCMLL